MVQSKDITIPLDFGTIAAKAWGDESGQPVLALHGWLDNASTFDLLIPILLEKNPNLYFVAMDFPGHGLSDHIPPNYSMNFMEYVGCVLAVLDKLQWTKDIILLAHSMGSSVAVLVAGIHSTRFRQLILLEGNGPYSHLDQYASQSYRDYWTGRVKYAHQSNNRIYSQRGMEKIIRMRQISGSRLKINKHSSVNLFVKLWKKVFTKSPKPLPKTVLSYESAKRLITRNMRHVKDNQYIWRTDPRLRVASAIFLTEKQVESFIQDIQAPVCILFAEDSPFYILFSDSFSGRSRHFKNLKVIFCQRGGHHVHMHEPKMVAKYIEPLFFHS